MDIKKLLASTGKLILTSRDKVSIRHRFIQAGYCDIPYILLGLSFYIMLIIGLLTFMLLILKISSMLAIILLSIVLLPIWEITALIVGYFIVKMYLAIVVFQRVQNIELNIPVFLREFATNLKAGREFVDALEDSNNSQLGTLQQDISQLILDIRSGMMIENVLKEYSARYDSYIITETFEIILEAYKGGGGLSEIIDRVAENLEVLHHLRKNAVASVSNYLVFTSIVALILAPLLFSLSYHLLNLIQDLLQKVVTAGSTSALSFIGNTIRMDLELFTNFSLVGICIIAASAASIFSIIKKGSIKAAPLRIVVFCTISILAYHIFQFLFGIFFATLYNI